MLSDAGVIPLGRRTASVAALDAVLVQMPWASIDTPSVALGRLKRSLEGAGIRCAPLYLNLAFARIIGTALYPRVVDERLTLLGEWLFGQALFGRPWGDQTLERSAVVRDTSLPPGTVAELRRLVDVFLDEAAGQVVARAPRLVVFPSMSTDAQQHCPSLALARLVKERLPAATIVLSGNSVEGIMGLETARRFDFVDVVISGDVDSALGQLAEEVIRGRPALPLRGVHRRGSLPDVIDDDALPNTPLEDLDRLPAADHGDYFEALARLGLDRDRPRILRFSTSRGCWWAQKNHCMFCSLHGKRPAYRAMSTDKALAELTAAVGEHGADLAMASDYIFNPDYFDDLVPALTRARLPIRIFYEVRPSLTKDQLGRLKQAGIDHFQAGIESFSTPLLRRIKKGSTGLQHVRFLKWAEELGLYVSWNILCGMPDAEADDYEASLRLFPVLGHLAPTAFVVEFILQRYSPYFVRRAEFYRRVRPLPAYDEIFAGFASEVVERLAYSFAGDHDGQAVAADYRRRLQGALAAWRAAHERSGLFWVEEAATGDVILLDTRTAAGSACIRLSGLAAHLYLACDDIRSLRSLEGAAREAGQPASRAEVERTLARLVEQGVMLREGASYLALALPLRGAALRPGQRDALLDVVRGDRALAALADILRAAPDAG